MSTASKITTAEQLFAIKDGNRYELVLGARRMMSLAGGLHGWIAAEFARQIHNHVVERRLGAVFAAETGFQIGSNPDTVRAPDVAFVSSDRLATVEDLERFIPLAPDLAVEVISPNDSSSEVESKTLMWISAGTKIVVVVDPKNRNLRVYRNSNSIEVLHVGDKFEAGDVLPEWTLEVGQVFPT